MDSARFVMMLLKPFLRIKKLSLDGEKYKDAISGGRIIASNHTGMLDPVILGSAFFFKRIFFLVAEVVMEKKLRGFMLRMAGCIKIERNKTDMEAIRKSVNVLKDGKSLIIFPQGKIIKEDEVSSIKSGTILIAAQAGVPIVPMYSAKRKGFLKGYKLIIGEPLYCRDYCTKKIPTLSEIEKLSEILLERMAQCREAYEKSEGVRENVKS